MLWTMPRTTTPADEDFAVAAKISVAQAHPVFVEILLVFYLAVAPTFQIENRLTHNRGINYSTRGDVNGLLPGIL